MMNNDWLQLTSDVVTAMAWPAAAIGLALMFKKPLLNWLDQATEINYAGVSLLRPKPPLPDSEVKPDTAPDENANEQELEELRQWGYYWHLRAILPQLDTRDRNWLINLLSGPLPKNPEGNVPTERQRSIYPSIFSKLVILDLVDSSGEDYKLTAPGNYVAEYIQNSGINASYETPMYQYDYGSDVK